VHTFVKRTQFVKETSK